MVRRMKSSLVFDQQCWEEPATLINCDWESWERFFVNQVTIQFSGHGGSFFRGGSPQKRGPILINPSVTGSQSCSPMLSVAPNSDGKHRKSANHHCYGTTTMLLRPSRPSFTLYVIQRFLWVPDYHVQQLSSGISEAPSSISHPVSRVQKQRRSSWWSPSECRP